jgi:hypothetical protein
MMAMDPLTNHILDELRTFNARQLEHNDTLIRLTVTVEEHVRRTDLLEAEMIPLKVQASWITMGLKTVAAIGALLVFVHEVGLI